ncbi:hypothetical protein NLJ89_g8323 [Agrocybe chaxingu]|uniref:Vacuolar sorting protein Vps3844 C-terminal domain-containing protein n=1 Tax=Agrocybe chaxingu TaxID=84603 RepID=A0A9W8JUN2_9AGAR|nr:hypothetical protein NLJ89_g8323 [Agrocybe chaxingu]
MLARTTLCLLLAAAAQAAQAVNVYLSPVPYALHSSLSPEDASAALSRHLGLEVFEPLRDASNLGQDEDLFVGKGPKNVLLLTVEEVDAKAVLPSFLQPAFTLETPPSTPIFSLHSVISSYLHRASHSFASLFPSTQFGEFNDVEELHSFFSYSEEPSFAAIELSKLHEIRKGLGASSDEYVEVATKLREFLEQLAEDDRYNLAILTYASPSSTSLYRRQDPQQTQQPLPSTVPPPQEPIGAISTCFKTEDDCNNGTTSCSGRGQCVGATKAGRTCFVCTCTPTKTGEGTKVKTEYWAGESCERKDVSGPFVLLTGTVIVILLLIAGSISLLYTVGDQPLPSTLLATAVHSKSD